MKHLTFYILISCLAILISALSFVSAVECNADLSQGGNSCTVSSSLTLNGTYNINMNGTTSSGALNITASNINLDCNGTTIYGNYSSGIGINVNANLGNINITNCMIVFLIIEVLIIALMTYIAEIL